MAGAPQPIDFKPLIGTDEATIDDKGRIILNKKKRERLGPNFVISIGAVGCLVAHPEIVWDRYLSEIFSYESINEGRAQYSRLVLGTAEDEMNCDMQGRFVVPSRLRDICKLKDKVLLVGCGDRIEFWDKAEWDLYCEDPDGYGKKRVDEIQRAYGRMVGK